MSMKLMKDAGLKAFSLLIIKLENMLNENY